MSEIVHYNMGDVEMNQQQIKFYAACGVLTGINTPRKSKTVNKFTHEKDKVTCENCKRTNVWKEEN